MQTNKLARDLGTRIREARLAMPHENGRPVSQETFADKVKVHWVTVSSWERGKSPPTLANLRRIAQVTGKSLEFFTAEGDSDDEEAAQVTAVMQMLDVLVDRALARRLNKAVA